jgi:Domain of unknown function (DUF4394)
MFTRLAAAGLAALTAATLAVAPGSGADASSRSRVCGTDRGRSLEAVGLTADQRLVCFRADKPRLARDIAVVSGLQMDTKLVGIDYRPANGVLYGVGDQAGIYTIDPATAVASLAVRANMPLSGTSFGVDFNPAADRLRIVGDSGQNLRINVADGTVTPDGGLTYPPSTAPALGVTGAMYTNNDADPNTVTTLFDVDSTLDQVAIQSPPNNGSLVSTGKLGVDTTPDVAADIYSEVKDGTTVSNTAYAALSSPQGSSFYSVDLLTGKASRTGDFSSRNRIVGVAFPQNQR